MNYCQSFCRTVQRLCNNIALPSQYQRVEYIQSTGTQYLNLGSLANHLYFDFIFEWVAYISNNNGAQYGLNGFAGCNGWGTLDEKIWLASSSAISFSAGGTRIGVASIVTGVKYHVVCSPTQFVLDGQDYTQATSHVNTSKNCYLFTVYGAQDADPRNWSSKTKVYHFKTSSIDLYPCYRKSDSKPGMYDIVNNTFYTNAGTGEFTVGNDV